MFRLCVLLISAVVIPQAALAQECYPTNVSFGWTQPNNVPITDDNAIRWPTDATPRFAYGGRWCPEEAQFELRDKDGNTVPAQVRMRTPFSIVENGPQALTVIDVDPIDELEGRQDYQVVVRPDNPSLPAFEEFILEFRTRNTAMEPLDIDQFEGIRAVDFDGDLCGEPRPFSPVNADIPACLVSSLFRLKLEFQPLNRPELSYLVYRTSTTPLDENGDEIAVEADNTRLPISFQPGARDLTGAGIPLRGVIFEVLYAPLPRRDCFSVVVVDEWGRERGDVANTACIDLVIPEPCPRGCMGMQCTFVFPMPNPFETNEPLPGQTCENVGLNGADPDRPIPEVGEEPGPGAGGMGGDTAPDGGPGASEGEGGSGQEGGGGSDGCAVDPAHRSSWLALLILPVVLRRRR